MKTLPTYIILLALLLMLTGCATTTPLMDAAQKGDMNAVKGQLGKGAPIDELGPYNTTALREAVDNGQLEIARYLIDKGANVNAQDTFGETPLLSAALKSHIEIARLLIDKGASINAKNYNGWTPLAYAKKGEMAKLLIEKGADVNALNNHGGTPLSSAGMSGSIDVVQTLIEKGADLDTALAQCQGTLEEWSKSSNKYLRERSSQPKKCIAILQNIKNERAEAKRREQEIAKAKEIESHKAREMKEIIREVVAETAKTQKQTVKSPAIQSDIDKPGIAASERIMGDNDLAVIIGIEGYSSLPKSDYSYDDARLVKEYAKALGFRERNIELITDEKATKTTIEKSLEVWLRNKTKPSSRIFIYYSGHGSPDPSTGESYIVPYDGDPNYLSVTGYPLKRLYEKLGSLPAAEVIVILDACFSGAGGRSVLAKGARPLVMSTATFSMAPNMAVLSATQGTQISTSSPERGHGLFTYYFLKAIQEGKKSIADIYEYLKTQVEDDAKAINVQQSPSISAGNNNLTGRFYLRK